MPDVTQILHAIAHGEAHAAAQLLPLVYDELRRLAARKLAQEAPSQTLQATALVHEAYLRLVGPGADQPWEGRGHFFAAAAEAMRSPCLTPHCSHGTMWATPKALFRVSSHAHYLPALPQSD
jgi:RNA polymerase sigma factor (TIGR02999 family)